MAILIKKDNGIRKHLPIKDKDNSRKGRDRVPALAEAGFLLERIAPRALRTFVTFQINNLSEADEPRSAAAGQLR